MATDFTGSQFGADEVLAGRIPDAKTQTAILRASPSSRELGPTVSPAPRGHAPGREIFT